MRARRQSAQASTTLGPSRGAKAVGRGQGREASRRPRQWLSSAIQVSSGTYTVFGGTGAVDPAALWWRIIAISGTIPDPPASSSSGRSSPAFQTK